MVIDPSGIFATNNTDPNGIDVAGVTLQGTVKCTYDDLVHAFGKPIDSETETAWLVRFNDYTVAKVYRTKTGLEALPTQYWDIAGFNKTAFILASTAIQRSQKEVA
jgi:hypothetical protein